MAVQDDDVDVWDNPGASPAFMSQGWDGHIGINVNSDPEDTLDRRNCRPPSLGDDSLSIRNNKGVSY